MFSSGCHVEDLVGSDVGRHADAVRHLTGFNLLRTPQFWEMWIALQLGGIQTEHKGEVDVEVEIWGRKCRAEVKFSQAFWSKYSGIRGKDWSRNVLKWAISAAQDARRCADCVILIGIDVDEQIYSWVVPFDAIPRGKRMLTVTAPSSRSKTSPGRLDRWIVPPTEILPAFGRLCHNRYDAPMRRAGIKQRRREAAAMADLLEAQA